MDLTKIDIIVSEVDGVITNGLDALDFMNNTLYKSFCIKDFEAINELKKVFTFVFLSSDPNISYGVMQKRNIPFFFTKSKETKVEVLTSIMSRYNMSPENLLYVASKLSDIPCMNLAEISFCPNDAPLVLYNTPNSSVINSSGGHGILTALYNTLKVEIDRRMRLL